MSRRAKTKTETSGAGDLSADSKLGKDDDSHSKPRGIRARLRQRRVWNSSEDEVRSRPTSLDLGRNNTTPVMLGSTGMHSLTTVPTHASGYYQDDDGDGPAGLALGEFGDHCDDVAEAPEEDDEYPGHHHQAVPKPSGAIVRSPSLEPAQVLSDGARNGTVPRSATAVSKRRVSVHSVPGYNVAVGTRGKGNMDYSVSEDYGGHTDDEHSMVNSGNYSYDYSYDDEGGEPDGESPGAPAADDFDGDGELNAVYLKRNADFHMLFRNIPINELLIDDYGCALQREILVQGRLYLTENFVCFYSNIFGWVTNLIIAFDQIVSIEKKMTALIIPNAIQVSTLHTKHFFGSFIYRDSAFNQLYDLWGKSRNEKNAGLPEIGQAEDGDGAGDVSRHREDVLNAYQSLSEDESRGLGGGSEFEEEGSVSASSESDGGGSASDVESAAANGMRAATDEKRPGVAADSAADGGGEASDAPDGSVHASTAAVRATAATIAASNSAAGTSASNTPVDLSRNHSHLSATTTKVPGTEANGTPAIGGSAASLPATAGKAPVERPSTSLLSRIPKTPDGTDAGSLASSARGKKHQATGSTSHQPPFHKPTTCPCGSSEKTAHYSMEALDAVFPLPMPLLFRIVFSATIPSDVQMLYMPADLVSKDELEQSCTKRIKECGNLDVKTEGWVPDPSNPELEMCIYSYEKLLGFAIGPKSTLVEDTFRITTRDFAKVVVVDQVVRTPNVPSGTSFFVKIRHCLTWASGPGNQPPGGWSHYRMTFELEWVKNSWFKGAIEKGSVDSNKQAAELLEKYIREWIAAHPSLEVKPPSSIGLSKDLAAAASGSSAAVSVHKRSRKPPGRKNKRDTSPHGLRMEELLGADNMERSSGPAKSEARHVSSADIARNAGAATSERAVPGATTVDELLAKIAGAIGPDAVAKIDEEANALAWKRRAEASLPGWICYHSVYPLGYAARRTARATRSALADPVAGPVLFLALLFLLVVSNLWNYVLYPSHVHVDGMRQMQNSVDALAEQMAAINQRLQELSERQKPL
ncbi:hypothetical protein GGH94_002030 [Coemansia aciculifera]|uniref:VASt domain-containing protein n=1 Tax=Coemansia aciculifera TaxID=417176 RepID=A0A9W8M7L8_9FUNG|nr:hypothetical protein GGH94_002030 [Coemansia aciculifera]